MLKMQKPAITFEFNWYKLKDGKLPIDGVDMQFNGTFGMTQDPAEEPVDGPTRPMPFDEPTVFGIEEVLT